MPTNLFETLLPVCVLRSKQGAHAVCSTAAQMCLPLCMHLSFLLSFDLHRYGDNIRSSWSNVLELVLRLDKLDLLPPAVEALIDADVWGVGPPGAPSPTKLAPGQLSAAQTPGLEAAPGSEAADANGASAAAGAAGIQLGTATAAAAAAAGQQQLGAAGPVSPAVSRPLQSARQRRAAAGASGSRGRSGGVGVGGAFLRSVTQLIALQEPEYEAKYATQVGLTHAFAASLFERVPHSCLCWQAPGVTITCAAYWVSLTLGRDCTAEVCRELLSRSVTHDPSPPSASTCQAAAAASGSSCLSLPAVLFCVTVA